MFKDLSQFIRSLFDLAFPAYCCHCNEILNRTEVIVCEKCYSGIPKLDDVHKVAFLNRIPIKHFNNINIFLVYNDLFQKLMHLYKYQEYTDLARCFAKTISDGINNNYDIITYVPLHESKERERGYNQSKIIAKIVAENLNLNLGYSLLSRQRYTTTQTELTRKERIKNVGEAFLVNKDVYNKSILIIDDVITTGATLNECSRVLSEAGCSLVDIAALATPTTILE